MGSDLFEDVPSRKGVIGRAIPKTLVEKVGLDVLLERFPETYQRALFSSWVASHFVSLSSCFICSWMAQAPRNGVLMLLLSLADLQVWCVRLEC